MLDEIREAMYSRTSGVTSRESVVAFFCRIAMRVSRSGGWTSTSRPEAKRERIRSSKPLSWVGGTSEVRTICLLFS